MKGSAVRIRASASQRSPGCRGFFASARRRPTRRSCGSNDPQTSVCRQSAGRWRKATAGNRYSPPLTLESLRMAGRSPSGGDEQVHRVRTRRLTQPLRASGQTNSPEWTGTGRRRLVQVLLTESGASLSEFNATEAYDELVLVQASFWSSERIRVRMFDRVVDQTDLNRVNARMLEAGDASAVCVSPLGTDPTSAPSARVVIVSPEELISRIERSPSVAWNDHVPQPAYERMDALHRLDTMRPSSISWGFGGYRSLL